MTNQIELLINDLNDEQKLAVKNPIYSCTKVVAGAGTGKTKIISKRFTKLIFDLINQNIDFPTSRILVITYTDKAANEMKNRIIKELEANNINSYDDELWISTIHGFCHKLLKKHSIEANLAPGFELADENELDKVYESIIKAIKYNEYNSISNINQICNELKLNPELLNIENIKKLNSIDDIDNILENILLIIKKIKAFGLSPKSFLEKTLSATQTFSQKLQSLPFGFPSTQDYVINWQNHLKPYIDDFCIFEADAAFADIAKKPVLTKNGTKKAEKWTPAENFWENIQNNTELELYITKITAIIYAIYQNKLETLNIIDFDDLINKTIYILQNNKTIRAYYQKFFKHIIIDEFQDTNGSQLELVKLLLNENNPNITFVGDRKQSIYGFRFAQMENLEVLHRYVQEKYSQKHPEIKLNTNYRSSEHVLNAVNYITTNHLNLNETLCPSEKKKQNEANKFVKNTIITTNNSAYEIKQTEAQYIATEILKLKAEKNAKFEDFAILIKFHSQADILEKVLTSYGITTIKKTNTSFFNHPTIQNALHLLRLLKNPTDEIALTRILKVQTTDKDLYNLKKEIDTIFSKQNIKINNKTINMCEKIIALYEQNQLPNGYLNSIYSTISKTIKDKKNKSLLQLFVQLGQTVKLYNTKTKIEQIQCENNLRIFEKIIDDYEQNKNYTNITNFLEYFEKISNDRYFELPNINTTQIDAVKIMTIHASKGLEFPFVFVCGISSKPKNDKEKITFDLQYGKKPGFGLILNNIDESITPKSLVYKNIWKKPRDLNENIRIFYVAVSRAEQYLNILTFKSKDKYQPAEYTINFPSWVIKEEIDANSIENIDNTQNPVEQKLTGNILPTAKQIQQNQTIEKHKFSFSQINTCNECSQKFVLKYKFHFPEINTTFENTQIGSIIHKLIYNSFLLNKEFSDTEIIQITKNLEFEQQELEDIKNLYKSFLNCPYTPSKLKGKKFFSEKTFDFNYKLKDKELQLVGDIDLIIETADNTFIIIDFKTNINLEQKKETYIHQLYLYTKAMEAQGMKIQTAKLVSLNRNKEYSIIESTPCENVKQEFEDKLLNAQNYLDKNLIPKKNKEKCKFCLFKYICF